MYLITGGAGFIGSHITQRLVRDGQRVRVFDNLSSGAIRNLDGIHGEVEVIEGDIRDRDLLLRAAKGVDVIYHQAAEPSVPRSIADPAATLDINVNGTLNVLSAARDQGCRRVVFATTCAIYGDSPQLPKVETLSPEPLSPYAMSKLTGEQLCAMFSRLYGLETVGLRYFNVFGPRQDPTSAYAAVVPTFLDAMLSQRRPRIYGDGEQSRDFVAVDDVVRANLLAATANHVSGRVFNIASGRAVTINQVVSTLSQATGIYLPAEHQPARPGDIQHSLADTSLASEVLGFTASMSLREGIDQMLLTHRSAMTAVAA